jgi:hypothetical protein
VVTSDIYVPIILILFYGLRHEVAVGHLIGKAAEINNNMLLSI